MMDDKSGRALRDGLSSPTEPQERLGPSGFDPSRVRKVILKLTPLEIALLLGKCDGYGSWMFEAAEYMSSLGLAREHYGSFYFDTPLAKAVIAELLRDSDGSPKGGDAEGGSVRSTTARAGGIAQKEPS